MGRMNLCRGCLSLWTGILATTALSLAGTMTATTSALALMILLPTVAVFSHPALHTQWPRPVRDALRAAAGSCVPLALHLIGSGRPTEGLLGLMAMVTIVAHHRVRRAPLRAHISDGCEELDHSDVCSGYRLQTEATVAHERELEDDLLKQGFIPKLPFEPTR
jgi:hypothetical protein